MQRIGYRFSVLLLICLAACARIPLAANWINASSPPDFQSGHLFFDDFSETSSGWDRFDGEIGTTNYQKESYLIRVNEPNTDLFATPGKIFKDVVIEVSAQRTGGSANNSFGVICRYKDEQNFYTAQISSDGYAGIFRMKDGKLKLLGHEVMIPAPSVLGGTGLNILRFECIGSSLALAVNGQPVDAREDKNFESGDIGLIAGTFEEGDTEVIFDDIRVMEP